MPTTRSGRYGASTDLSSSRSRDEIEKAVMRYGATGFGYAVNGQRGIVQFQMHDRQIKFSVPLPNRHSREFTHTESRQMERTAKAAEAAYEQAVRQTWRALALVVKAKLEAVEAAIVTFEQEFGMHIVLPDGRTVAEYATPFIEASYALGAVATMEPLPALPRGS